MTTGLAPKLTPTPKPTSKDASAAKTIQRPATLRICVGIAPPPAPTNNNDANHLIVDASGLISLFHLDLNGRAVIVSSAGKDRQVATRDLVLAAHQLADWSDCINDGCARRVGHETLKWL
jgi:hypothetical protein